MKYASVRVSKPCRQCGAIMADVIPRRQYCAACRKARAADRSAAWWMAHKPPPKKPKPVFRGKAADKYRPDAHKPQPADRKTRLQRVLAGEIPPTREDHLTLGQVCMLADKAGMNYGKYAVKYGL